MSKRCGSWITWVTLAVAVGLAAPSHATTGTVRVTVAKAGFIVGAGGGKGVLTFRHRNYPFTVQGLSHRLSELDTGPRNRGSMAMGGAKF